MTSSAVTCSTPSSVFVNRTRALLGRGGGTGMEQCLMVSLIRGRLLDTITRPEISGIAQQIGRKREALLDRRSRCLSEARSRWASGIPEHGAFGPAQFVIDPINREWWVGEKRKEMTGLSSEWADTREETTRHVSPSLLTRRRFAIEH